MNFKSTVFLQIDQTATVDILAGTNQIYSISLSEVQKGTRIKF